MSNGDSIVGKVSYRTNFYKKETILIKRNRFEQKISVDKLSKILLSTGELYTVIPSGDSSHRKKIATTLIDGSLGLYSTGKTYYLRKDTNIFELDNKTIKVKREGREITTRSKKYLSTLHAAFMDCQTLDYTDLAKNISLKSLTKLVHQYNKCKNIPIRDIARKSTIEVAFVAGVSHLGYDFSFANGSTYGSGASSSYSLSFLKDVLYSSNRLKFRVDLNYLKSSIKGSYTAPFTGSIYWGASNEYNTFSTSFNGLRIPVGLQYYFFNNTSSLYLSGGIVIGVNTYKDFDAKGYLVYNEGGTKIYEPLFNEKFVVTRPVVFPGVWYAIGGDIALNNKLKLNMELKGIRSEFNITARTRIENVVVNEFSPSLGLKYKIR